jgi:hypothetical protein
VVVAVIIGAHKGWTCPSPGGFGSPPRRGEQCELLLLLPSLPLLVRARALPAPAFVGSCPAGLLLPHQHFPPLSQLVLILGPLFSRVSVSPLLTSATGGLVDEVRGRAQGEEEPKPRSGGV